MRCVTTMKSWIWITCISFAGLAIVSTRANSHHAASLSSSSRDHKHHPQPFEAFLAGIKKLFGIPTATTVCDERYAQVSLVRLNNHRAYYFSPITQLSTWEAASTYCTSRNMYLPTIDSIEEQLFLWDYANTLGAVGAAGKPGAWIGLNDRTLEGSYVWAQSRLTTALAYWGASQPSTAVGNNCVKFAGDSTQATASWATFDCTLVTAVTVCEVPDNCSKLVTARRV